MLAIIVGALVKRKHLPPGGGVRYLATVLPYTCTVSMWIGVCAQQCAGTAFGYPILILLLGKDYMLLPLLFGGSFAGD